LIFFTSYDVIYIQHRDPKSSDPSEVTPEIENGEGL
jgi:hypothetical protein